MGCGTQIITKNNYIIMYTLKKCGVKTIPSKFHKLLQKNWQITQVNVKF